MHLTRVIGNSPLKLNYVAVPEVEEFYQSPDGLNIYLFFTDTQDRINNYYKKEFLCHLNLIM